MEHNAAQSRDTRYITLLSVVACLSVVILHTNNCVWRFSETELYWKTANIIESVFYFAVPTFFMISGATLMDYNRRYSTWEFFRKRIVKTVIPFVAWSIIGLFFAAYVLKTVNFAEVGKRFLIDSILDAEVVSYFWFFPPLFCVYLSIPVLAAVEQERRREVFTYLAVAGYLINTVIPFLNSKLGIKLSFPIEVYAVSQNLQLAVVGYLLARYECSAKWKKIIAAAAVAALLVHIVGTYFLSMEAGTTVRTFKHKFISVPYAAGIFLLAKTWGNRIMDTCVSRLVLYLKKYTFSIYLLHWFVVRLMKHLFVFDDTSLVYRLGGLLIIVPVCIAVTAVLRKIPLVRHLVPQ